MSSSSGSSRKNKTKHLKSDLFIRIHDLKGIHQQLEKLMLLPKHKRNEWVEENESVLQSMLETYIEDSIIAVDSLDQDKETLNLSLEYVSFLRDVVYRVRNILYEFDELES